MMLALDIMPWAMPALLTVLVGAGVILRRGHTPGRQRAASLVMGAAILAGVLWIASGVLLALRAIA